MQLVELPKVFFLTELTALESIIVSIIHYYEKYYTNLPITPNNEPTSTRVFIYSILQPCVTRPTLIKAIKTLQKKGIISTQSKAQKDNFSLLINLDDIQHATPTSSVATKAGRPSSGI